MKKITIIGAGPVGCALSYLLATEYQYEVDLFELNDTPDTWPKSRGRSFNLTMSKRGLVVLDRIGLLQKVKKASIPVSGRMIHFFNGAAEPNEYGGRNDKYYSLLRTTLNQLMIENLSRVNNVKIHYLTKVTPVNIDTGEIEIENLKTHKKTRKQCDLILACDGINSGFQQQLAQYPFFSRIKEYHRYAYKEIIIPKKIIQSVNYSHKYLHFWPRGKSLVLGFPNLDGSFTFGLFMHVEELQELENLSKIHEYFSQHFPDIYNYMKDLLGDYLSRPIGHLSSIQCYPWTYKDKLALVGDSAHAIYPFYGQGCNFSLENAAYLVDLVKKCDHDWYNVFQQYQYDKKPEAKVVYKLAKEHADFLCTPVKPGVHDMLLPVQKCLRRLDDRLTDIHNNVNFTQMSYIEAAIIHRHYKTIMSELLETLGIDTNAP